MVTGDDKGGDVVFLLEGDDGSGGTVFCGGGQFAAEPGLDGGVELAKVVEQARAESEFSGAELSGEV